MKKITIILFAVLTAVLFNGMAEQSWAKVPEQDSLALVALYDSTDGANWTNNSNWLTGPVSTWFGITVEYGRVYRVDLSLNNLVGTIPPEIGHLTAMRELHLSRNQLSGSIPIEIGNLTHLTNLTLNHNQLSGSIPTEIGNLINLQRLYLSLNTLSGSIPGEIGKLTNLTNLSLNQNQLSGTIPIELFNLTNLSSLLLNVNQLSGSLPPEIGNLTRLKIVSFYSNQLSGAIPPEIQNLTQLTNLVLAINQFSGAIPIEIGNMTELSWLDLSRNQLSGPIPKEIGNLSNLTNLNITGNKLAGSIPGEIGNLINLTSLSIGQNQCSGTIPPELGNLTKLEYLYLASNQLSDTIPKGIGNLTKLRQLYLNINQLTGAVPSEFRNLMHLTTLHLNSNRLTELPNLSPDTSLIDLRIQYNKFTFEDIEPNLFVTNFSYSPQDSVGVRQDTTIDQGASLTISASVGGTANEYQWMKDGIDVPGANTNSYTIVSAGSADHGSYVCRITNTLATALTLYSRPIRVTVAGAVGVGEFPEQVPGIFALYQNYPNPFNSVTQISYYLPKSSRVVLKIYNIQGQVIRTLVDGIQPAGIRSILWNGLDNQGKKAGSGSYFYRIEAGEFCVSKKMILMQ